MLSNEGNAIQESQTLMWYRVQLNATCMDKPIAHAEVICFRKLRLDNSRSECLNILTKTPILCV